MSEPVFYRQVRHSPTPTAIELFFYVHVAGWFACSPDYHVKRSGLHDYQLRHVIRGRGFASQGGDTVAVGAGQTLFLNMYEPHEYFADSKDPWEVVFVHFGGRLASRYNEHLTATGPLVRSLSPERVQRALLDVYTLLHERGPGHEPRASAQIALALAELCAVAEPRSSGASTRPLSDPILQATQYLQDSIRRPVRLADAARHVKLSSFHLAREFKRQTGKSVMQYLTEFRMMHACNLLEQSSLSVRQVAERCGFADQSHFGAAFKRAHGMTPLQYRASHQEQNPS
ncbi:MAG: AraC family transcriptional regulator [Firmicutes bacterium]|nr:AraC family transcriptional regulator [Bacillota bacterium]